MNWLMKMKMNIGLTMSQRANLTPFQIKVYEATMQVPLGKVGGIVVRMEWNEKEMRIELFVLNCDNVL